MTDFDVNCVLALFGVGCLIFLGIKAMIKHDRAVKQRDLENGLVAITIVRKCEDATKQEWYLVETADGQRCYLNIYRGSIDDCFKIHYSLLRDYYPPKGMNLTLPEKSIVTSSPDIQSKKV